LRPPSDAQMIATMLLGDAFDAHAGDGWQWCEDVMTYDNARLCEALLRGGAMIAGGPRPGGGAEDGIA